MIKLKIKEVEVELVFRFSLLLALSKLWNIAYVEQVIARLNVFDGVSVDTEGNVIGEAKMPVQFFSDLVDVVKTAAKLNNVELNATDDEIADGLFADMDVMAQVMSALVEAMPKPKQEVNPTKRSAKK